MNTCCSDNWNKLKYYNKMKGGLLVPRNYAPVEKKKMFSWYFLHLINLFKLVVENKSIE